MIESGRRSEGRLLKARSDLMDACLVGPARSCVLLCIRARLYGHDSRGGHGLLAPAYAVPEASGEGLPYTGIDKTVAIQISR